MQARMFEYPGLIGSWEHRSNNTELTQSRLMGINFHGTRGTLYVDRAGMRVTPEKGSDLAPVEMKRVADPHPLHWANFLECVRTRKRPNSDIETCVRSSITSILGNLSLRAQTRLDWNEDARRWRGGGAGDVAQGGPVRRGGWRHDWAQSFAGGCSGAGLGHAGGGGGARFRAKVGIGIYSLRYLAEKDLAGTLRLIRECGLAGRRRRSRSYWRRTGCGRPHTWRHGRR